MGVGRGHSFKAAQELKKTLIHNTHSPNPACCSAPAIPLSCPFPKLVFQCQIPSRSPGGRGYPLAQLTGRSPQMSGDWPLLTMTAHLPGGISKHELIQSPGENKK